MLIRLRRSAQSLSCDLVKLSMSKFFLTIAAALTTMFCFAQQTKSMLPADVINPGFEQFDLRKNLPYKWHLMSRNEKQYRISSDSIIKHTGSRSLLITSADTASAPQFAGVGYVLPARYTGKEITVQAWMRTEDMKGSLGLMLGYTIQKVISCSLKTCRVNISKAPKIGNPTALPYPYLQKHKTYKLALY